MFDFINSNYSWLFSGAGISILLLIGGYLLNVIRKCYLHRKFEPIIFVQNHKSNIIQLLFTPPSNIEVLVNEAVNRENNRLPTYNMENSNPYFNPWLLTPAVETKNKNRRYYMTQKAQYLSSFRDYQHKIITQQENDKTMVAIPLCLRNDGKSQGKDIEIELTLKGMFYDDNCKVEINAIRNAEPIDNGNNQIAYMMTPMTRVEFKYHNWNLQQPISSPLYFKIPHLNPKGFLNDPFIVMYVNTCSSQELVINYKILESTLETPVEGKIEIMVHDS